MKLKSTIYNIMAYIITGLFLILLAIIATDYIRFRSKEEPLFCIEKAIYDYRDGSVSECKGIVYNIYEYNRESLKGSAFVPFWVDMDERATKE